MTVHKISYADNFSSPVSSSPRWVVVARILGPRGNKGEVAAELLTDFAERLTHLKELFLGHIHNDQISGALGHPDPHPIPVQSCWLSQNHRGQCVFHFAGSASINDAEKFRGLHVLLPFDQRVTLQSGQYFVADLVGCSIFENPPGPLADSSSPCFMSSTPQFLGKVRDVHFPGERENLRGTPLLQVDTAQGELLIPLALDICKHIDTSARRIDVVLPEGLRDLNVE